MEFILIIISTACAWLLWKLLNLQRGIQALTVALRNSDGLPNRDSVSALSSHLDLRQMTSAVLDSMAESELEKSIAEGRRQILEFVLNRSEDGFLIVDDTLQIKYSNTAARSFFPGQKSPEGIQLIEFCFDHRIVETVALALENREKITDRVEISNRRQTLQIEAEPIDPSLQIGPGAWLIIRDLTAELALEQTRQDFVANASHELKTPLSIIKGYLEVIAGDNPEDRMVQIMQKHTDRITRIVDDMLSISKLEQQNGSKLLTIEPFDLGECVHGIVEQLQPLIEQNQSCVKIKLPESGHCIYSGDRFYFDQIFFNLIENALKQNPRPGLKIQVKIKTSPNGGRLLIEVIDDGVGIPAADLSEVFKRFYRVAKHHSQTIKGTGLGLSIVKRAVQAHRGEISVSSTPGKETRFLISLPLSNDQTLSDHRSNPV